MPYVFNPLTGNLDYFKETSGGSTSYTPSDSSKWSPEPSTVAGALDQLASRTTKYIQSFIITDFVLDTDYKITINEASHLKGIYPTVTVYELVGGIYEEVMTGITISNAGVITITVSSSPDLRFDGRVIVE